MYITESKCEAHLNCNLYFLINATESATERKRMFFTFFVDKNLKFPSLCHKSLHIFYSQILLDVSVNKRYILCIPYSIIRRL